MRGLKGEKRSCLSNTSWCSRSKKRSACSKGCTAASRCVYRSGAMKNYVLRYERQRKRWFAAKESYRRMQKTKWKVISSFWGDVVLPVCAILPNRGRIPTTKNSKRAKRTVLITERSLIARRYER